MFHASVPGAIAFVAAAARRQAACTAKRAPPARAMTAPEGSITHGPPAANGRHRSTNTRFSSARVRATSSTNGVDTSAAIHTTSSAPPTAGAGRTRVEQVVVGEARQLRVAPAQHSTRADGHVDAVAVEARKQVVVGEDGDMEESVTERGSARCGVAFGARSRLRAAHSGGNFHVGDQQLGLGRRRDGDHTAVGADDLRAPRVDHRVGLGADLRRGRRHDPVLERTHPPQELGLRVRALGRRHRGDPRGRVGHDPGARTTRWVAISGRRASAHTSIPTVAGAGTVRPTSGCPASSCTSPMPPDTNHAESKCQRNRFAARARTVPPASISTAAFSSPRAPSSTSPTTTAQRAARAASAKAATGSVPEAITSRATAAEPSTYAG